MEQAKKMKELQKENAQLRRAIADLTVEKQDPEGHRGGRLLSPERRRIAVQHAREKGLSERRACRLAHQPRGTQRYQPTQRNDEDQLTQAIVGLARSARPPVKRCCPATFGDKSNPRVRWEDRSRPMEPPRSIALIGFRLSSGVCGSGSH